MSDSVAVTVLVSFGVVPLRLRWSAAGAKGQMVLSSVSVFDEETKQKVIVFRSSLSLQRPIRRLFL